MFCLPIWLNAFASGCHFVRMIAGDRLKASDDFVLQAKYIITTCGPPHNEPFKGRQWQLLYVDKFNARLHPLQILFYSFEELVMVIFQVIFTAAIAFIRIKSTRGLGFVCGLRCNPCSLGFGTSAGAPIACMSVSSSHIKSAMSAMTSPQMLPICFIEVTLIVFKDCFA